MMPDLEVIHCSAEFILDWVEYSCFDAEILYFLRETLAHQLQNTKVEQELMGNLLTLYQKYWLPFGDLLTKMEDAGLLLDSSHLKLAERRAQTEADEAQSTFLNYIYNTQEDAKDFNASSTIQMQQLLFAPFAKKGKEPINNGGNPFEKDEYEYDKNEIEYFRVENKSGWAAPGDNKVRKYRDMAIRGMGLKPISYTEKGMPQADANVIRQLAGKDP